MACSSINAVVYIWYVEGGNLGHASMYIGDPLNNMTIDLPFDAFYSNEMRSQHRAFIARTNTRYVSWWPEKKAGLFNKKPQGQLHFLEEDMELEDMDPHVEYKLQLLDESAMSKAWDAIRNKPGANYQTLRKNCATVVMRVLRAGGALDRLSPLKRGWFSHSLVVTPNLVAQLCNEMCKVGLARKSKSIDCPRNHGVVSGFRKILIG